VALVPQVLCYVQAKIYLEQEQLLPLGPVALAACLQLAACTPNFFCQEHMTLGEGLLEEPFTVRDGFVDVPDGPGLGIGIDEAALAARKGDGSWQTPQLRLADGSFAEW